MAIETSNTAAQDFVKKAASLAPGTAKTRTDPRFFEIMMQNGFGINGQVSGSSTKDMPAGMVKGLEMLSKRDGTDQDAALTMLGYQTTTKGLTGGSGGLDQFQGNALATLSRLAMEQSSKAAKGTTPADAKPVTDVKPAAAGNVVRHTVDKSSVRMAVNKLARHPDDLGHLRGVAVSGTRGGGFTKREEELLLAAAGAENLLAEDTRTQVARAKALSAGKVLPSTLERRAGDLSAQYESNNEIACIGYDRCGGTSYGQFQIASKTGTMDAFVKFLDSAAPDIAAKLKAAGPADTGGKTGQMPSVWKQIAAADPKRFEALQHEFIRSTSYAPAAKSLVLTTGVDVTQRSYALREVLWSTAVQHGPGGAERIFSRAIEKAEATATSQDFDKTVIEEVYRIRGQKFFRHTKRVREAVQSRFQDEKTTALALLDGVSA
jgi:hypothetical protein